MKLVPVSEISQRKQGRGEISRSVLEELDLKVDSKILCTEIH